jgi:pimeloyl-ACP methyl ester carboxylesterase
MILKTAGAFSLGLLLLAGAGAGAQAAAKAKQSGMAVATTVFGEDAFRPPESWARRAYPKLIYYNQVPKGGHFAAWEQPELFASELRAAFRSLR